jgi:hypothetical protein
LFCQNFEKLFIICAKILIKSKSSIVKFWIVNLPWEWFKTKAI